VPDDDLLSEAEEQVIDSIFDDHGGKHWTELVKMTHGFAEWEDPQGSSTPLTYEKVLGVEDFTYSQIEEIVRNIDEEIAIAATLAGTHVGDPA
jgi:hypothetical protein